MQEFGIDYASVDGNKHPIDFRKVASVGCRFAIVRGAWGTWKDPCATRDRLAIRNAGIAFGAYLFLRYPSKLKPVPEPEDQARALINVLGTLEPGELPPCLDIEFPGGGRKDTIFSVRQAMEWSERAYKTLEQVYGTVMTYTSSRVWMEDLLDQDSDVFGRHPLWMKVPYYWKARRPWDVTHFNPWGTARPRPWRNVTGSEKPNAGMWVVQIQGDSVALPGFSSTVDINLFAQAEMGEKSQRVKWIQTSVLSHGFSPGSIDGDFGPKTQHAIKSFQSRAKLPATGIVDVKTFAHLCA